MKDSSGAALLDRIRVERVVAIVRGRDSDASLRTVEVLWRNGIGIVEVSLSGIDALAVLRELRARVPQGALLGAGTVLTEADLDAVLDVGVDLVVTPGLTDGARAAARRGVPLLCGALTPTEVWQAHALGATAVKVFPASLHGPDYLAALREPFPQVPLVAVGGVRAEHVGGYLAAGAVGVGVGSPLVGDAARAPWDDGTEAVLAQRIEAFRAAVDGSAGGSA